jgi:hypothetical protein
MKTKTALTVGIVLASFGAAQAAMIATDFAWVSTTAVNTDSTSLTDSPTNSEFTVSTGALNFSRSGTAALVNTGGPLAGTITLSFDKEITDLTLTVSDFDFTSGTIQEWWDGFSIAPSSVSGSLVLNGGTRVDPTINNSAGTLTWTSLPAGTTSISFTHHRLSNGLGIFLNEMTATTVVPEPSSTAAWVIGSLLFLRRRR